jgi:transcriptional regulator GlxA family with amidase domain
MGWPMHGIVHFDNIRSNLAKMILHLALNGVTESSLALGVDIVATAARLAGAGGGATSPALRQRVVSLDGRPVHTGSGRPLAVDGALRPRALRPADVVVLPGWFGATEDRLDALLGSDEARHAATALRQAAARGALLCASCSATFLLAHAGLLEGRRATTTWWLAAAFARRYPGVSLAAERMVVDEGPVITAGTAFAHADLMLAVVARLAGPTLAGWVMRYLVLDSRPTQSRYMVVEHLRLPDESLQKAERFILGQLQRRLTLEEVARAAAVSPRTLARRVHDALGMTPHAWIQHLRVSRAMHLLETSRLPVDEIAARVGYADPAAFRRAFRRIAGESPRSRRTRPPTPTADEPPRRR